MKRLAGALFWAIVRRSRTDALTRLLGRLYLRVKPFVMFAGTPTDRQVRTAICTVDGWVASAARDFEFSLRLQGTELPFLRLRRTDAQRIFGEQCRGFRTFFDLSQFRLGNALLLEVVSGGSVVAAQDLTVTAEAMLQADAAAANRASKREWILQHLACERVPEGTPLDFLPEEWKREFKIDDPAAISAHAYDEVATGIIEEVRRTGGKVLDCGSGLRANVDDTVICVEVTALPTVDVLAVNQRLPFRDGVFDAVLSLNVLEHVTDPFRCADELVRVLKPGGVLYCCMPFLQPEHGYPHHYFNATRSGLAQLFAGRLKTERTFVPGSGEPVWTLSWFLASYAAELPEEERRRFLRMRVHDVVNAPPQSLLEKNWVARLSDSGKWELASTTAGVFRKLY